MSNTTTIKLREAGDYTMNQMGSFGSIWISKRTVRPDGKVMHMQVGNRYFANMAEANQVFDALVEEEINSHDYD